MKNYRIVRLAGLHYSDAVVSFLEQHPDYTQKSYDNQLQTLFQYSPIFSDGFSRSFHDQGQEAIELVIDFEVLQKQWAKENGVLYSPDNWMFEIMMAQVEVLKPDIVYIQSHVFNIPGMFIKNRPNHNLAEILKEKFPFIRLLLMFSGYPSSGDRIKGIDVLFVGAPSLKEFYQKMGFASNLLYHSFDESIINKLDNIDKRYDFTFAGSYSMSHNGRYIALKQLFEETNVEAWLYEHKQECGYKSLILPTVKQALRSFVRCGFGVLSSNMLKKYNESNFLPKKLRNIISEIICEGYVKEINSEKSDRIGFSIGRMSEQVSLREMYPERCHAPVMGMDMYNLLYQSKVTFNKHADVRWGGVGNMRMFEATGVGTCLITDTGKNMRDLFEPDKEVVTYTSIDEAVEKVNYLMGHKKTAAEIASAGQRRTLKDHTIKIRYQQVDEVIQKAL